MLQTIRNIFKIEDLRKRIVYTLLMLAIVRLGALIPSPLMNAEVVKTYFASANSVMQLFDIMSGNAFSQMNLFAMGITPYINSSIIISLLTVAIPKLQELQEDGESGRKKITQYTRYLTIILALIQSFGISFGNRVYAQIRRYVPVYSSCGLPAVEALDQVLSRKVLRKLGAANPVLVRSRSGELLALLAELFGEGGAPLCEAAVRRISDNG